MSATNTAENSRQATTPVVPVIIDLGKISRKKVKQLKKGEGVYLEEVEPAIAQFKADLAAKSAGKEILPVIVLYQKKPRKSMFPTLGLLS